jgi:hypothetical protein
MSLGHSVQSASGAMRAEVSPPPKGKAIRDYLRYLLTPHQRQQSECSPPKGQGMRDYLQTVYNGRKWNSPKSSAVEFMCTRWIEVVRKRTWCTSSLACNDCAFAQKHPTAALDGFPTTSTLLTENARSRNPNPKSEHL